MKTYVINADRIEHAETAKEAEAKALARGINVRHKRVLDDHSDAEIADVIARMAIVDDTQPELSGDELEWFAANAAGALRAKHEGQHKLSLSEAQRSAVKDAMKALGVRESVFNRPSESASPAPSSGAPAPRLRLSLAAASSPAPAPTPAPADAAPEAKPSPAPVSSMARSVAKAAEANAKAEAAKAEKAVAGDANANAGDAPKDNPPG